MADYTRAQVGRAAAILTTGEVAGTALSLDGVKDRRCVVDLTFTIGSLTNVTVRFYGSQDGTTYDPLAVNGGDVLNEVLTGSAERMYVIPSLPGVKFFRVSLQGSGSTGSSTAAFTYRYDRLGAP